MMKFIIPFLFYSVMLFNVNAKDLETIKQSHLETVMKCSKEKPVAPQDMEKFIKLQMPENDNTKCLLACIFKALGMMDDQGMLSVQGVNEFARIFLSEDPEGEQPKKAKHFTDACLSVNDVEVSDGDEGCERAALMFICGAEKVPEFEFIEEIAMKTVYYSAHHKK